MKRHRAMQTALSLALLVAVGLGSSASSVWAGARQHGGGGHGSAGGGGRQSSGRATARRGGESSAPNAATPASGTSAADGGETTPGTAGAPHATPRDGQATRGKAVARGSTPPPTGGPTVIVPGYGYGLYPWGFGGLGFGGYYGGYYDPGYGGYAPYPQGGSFSSDDQGALRLIVKPEAAQVYVDGYYAGIVDDFDGIFQRLHLPSGPHHIEVRAAGFEPLVLDVQIQRDQTTTYRGELKPIQ